VKVGAIRALTPRYALPCAHHNRFFTCVVTARTTVHPYHSWGALCWSRFWSGCGLGRRFWRVQIDLTAAASPSNTTSIWVSLVNKHFAAHGFTPCTPSPYTWYGTCLTAAVLLYSTDCRAVMGGGGLGISHKCQKHNSNHKCGIHLHRFFY